MKPSPDTNTTEVLEPAIPHTADLQPIAAPETALSTPRRGKVLKQIGLYSTGVIALAGALLTAHQLRSADDTSPHSADTHPHNPPAVAPEQVQQEEATVEEEPIIISDEAAEQALHLCAFHREDKRMEALQKDRNLLTTWRNQQMAMHGGKEPTFPKAIALVTSPEREDNAKADLWERVNQELALDQESAQ